jgi:hypothetical protein
MSSLREHYKAQYDQELARKAELTSSLSLPVGVLTILMGGLVVMAKELHAPLANGDAAQLVALSISAVVALIVSYLLFRSYYNYTYGYLATPVEMDAYYEKLVAFHMASGQSERDARRLAEDETLKYIATEYSKYADRNAKNNDIKSSYLHQANGAMVAALVLGATAAGINIAGAVSSAAPTPRVEVVNLKELTSMQSQTPVQAATSPPSSPPPPAPSPPTRPEPPPGRLIKEDHRPPKPPEPPRR